MSIFQLIASLFALLMFYVTSIHKRKLHLSDFEVSFWYSIWFLFLCFALFPDLLTEVTHALHFSRVFDLLLIIALMFLTVLMVYSYFSMLELKKKIVDLSRYIALHKVERKGKN